MPHLFKAMEVDTMLVKTNLPQNYLDFLKYLDNNNISYEWNNEYDENGVGLPYVLTKEKMYIFDDKEILQAIITR